MLIAYLILHSRLAVHCSFAKAAMPLHQYLDQYKLCYVFTYMHAWLETEWLTREQKVLLSNAVNPGQIASNELFFTQTRKTVRCACNQQGADPAPGDSYREASWFSHSPQPCRMQLSLLSDMAHDWHCSCDSCQQLLQHLSQKKIKN